MAWWLLKADPLKYLRASLEREKKMSWGSMANDLALSHSRTMDEKSIVGIAEIVTNPYPDPQAVSPAIARCDRVWAGRC